MIENRTSNISIIDLIDINVVNQKRKFIKKKLNEN